MSDKKNIFLLLFFALLAAFLNVIFFYGLKSHQFVFSGDQFFRFTYDEALANSYFLRKQIYLGELNAWQFITQFWDANYYLIANQFGLSLPTVEKIHTFLILFLSLSLSFLGFAKINQKEKLNLNVIFVGLISFWYCFNPYTLELWHGGVYNLGSCLTYALAPLIFFYFKEAIFSSTSYYKILICAFLLSLASYTFWLLAPLILFLGLYFLFKIFSSTVAKTTVFKNLSIFLLSYIPLVSFILFTIMYEYFTRSADVNSQFDPTYGNMQGGIWYQLAMYFSWGIYTEWYPRSLYPFADYFFSKTYITGIVGLYLLVLAGIILSVKNKQKNKASDLTKLIFIFCLAVFLAKGSQPPLGEVFTFMYEKVPFFSVFRTPDIRFGFIIVLILSILLLLTAKTVKKFFIPIFVVLIFMQSWLLINGTAFKGKNVADKFYDRVVHIPDSYKEAANFINDNSKESFYILPLPPIEYGVYSFDENEKLIGQDMFRKLVRNPFVYISSAVGIAKRTHDLLNEIITKEEFERLSDFPIKYIVLREDIKCIDCVYSEEKIKKVAQQVFKNKVFKVYEMNKFKPIIDSSDVFFKQINPVKYIIRFNNLSAAQELSFLQSYNDNWKLFPIQADYEMSQGEMFSLADLKYLFRTPIAEDKKNLKSGFANSWIVSPDEIERSLGKDNITRNEDGSLKFSLVLIYYSQIKFILFALISLGMSIFVLSAIVLIRSRRGR